MYKNLIAFALGFIVIIIFTPLVIALYSFSASIYGYNEGILGQILGIVCGFISIAGCVYAGMWAYYSLCNKTKYGINIGYGLYGLSSLICAINVYYKFVYYQDIFSGTFWIVAIATGLIGTIKYSKLEIIEVEKY